MTRKRLGLAMQVWMVLVSLIAIGIVTQCANADAVNIEDTMVSPSELENGYWVQVYREYIDRNNDYWEPLLDDYNYNEEDLGFYRYVVLVDLDFDGEPEAVAVKETIKSWYVTADIIDIDRDGTCTITELEGLQMDSAISLYIGEDGPVWIKVEESDYKGTATKDYYRFSYSKADGAATESWLSEYSEYDYWEIDEPTNTDYTRTYYVNGEEVSYEDYRKEDTRDEK